MALHTSRVTLGTDVTNPATRHPAVTASALATLDEAAPGREVLGMGLGDSAVETMGMKPSRLAAFEQTVHRMRALLAGEEVAFEHGSLHLKHHPPRPIPIYGAASGPKVSEEPVERRVEVMAYWLFDCEQDSAGCRSVGSRRGRR